MKKIKNKEERYESFIEWTTFLKDRINVWKDKLPENIQVKLDGTPNSLTYLGEYVLENYSIDDQSKKNLRPTLDAIISYVADVFFEYVPETVWKIDLEDESNIYYNLPHLVFKLGAPVCPHFLLRNLLSTRNAAEFSRVFRFVENERKEYEAFVKSKKA